VSAKKPPDINNGHLCDQALVNDCRDKMRRGSLSFFLASRLLGEKAQDAIMMLYAWCRYADDLIDQTAENLPPDEKASVVENLRLQTTKALRCSPSDLLNKPIAFQAMGYLGRRYGLPAPYPEELILGMKMDTDRQTYPDLDHLRVYCYRVAGVVGVMFSHIIGVSDAKALPHAAHLGIAMQMTNISRDVLEDAAMGRIYLPLDWLQEEAIPLDPTLFPQFKSELARVILRLLKTADAHYAEAEAGIKYLPLRAAWAVASARYIYDGIGTLVKRRGAKAWDSRAVVPLRTKILLLLRGLGLVLKTVPYRLSHPWQRQQIEHIWRYNPCKQTIR
jgi:phytoene synthase